MKEFLENLKYFIKFHWGFVLIICGFALFLHFIVHAPLPLILLWVAATILIILTPIIRITERRIK